MNSSSLFRLEMVSVVDPEMVKWASEGGGVFPSLWGEGGRQDIFPPFSGLTFFQPLTRGDRVWTAKPNKEFANLFAAL